MEGLTNQQLYLISGILKNHSSVQKAVLFGSRAKGNYSETSDIDIALWGSNGVLDRRVLLMIKGDFDESNITVSVDFQDFNQISNTDLIEHIKRIGITIYQKSPK